MPTDTKAILELSRSIATLAKKFENGGKPAKHLQDTLVDMAEKLSIAARDPDENMYFNAGETAHNAAIRSVISMGVLDEMPLDGSAISIEELASRLKINAELVGRILRACASTHFFSNPTLNHYAHNALSRAYLSEDNRYLAAQIYDYTGKGVFAIPEFGASNRWTSAGDYYNGPFQLGYDTKLGYWDYLQEKPERMQSFNTGMRVGKIGRRRVVFPFGDVLQHDPCGDNEIAIVDVGGGRGQSLEDIREDWPLMKGRLILQDLPEVVADAVKKGVPSFIEISGQSFFEKQSVIGARIYYFRRIFHCWTREKSQEILENTKKAMNEYSRVLIADMVLPDIDCPRDLALQDLNMMSLGGVERSESEWKQLIESAGLTFRKIWLDDMGPKHAIIEAVLPGFKGHQVG